MKLFSAFFAFLFLAVSGFAATPAYDAFVGTNGIFVRTNPPQGRIIIDGSGITGTPGGSTGSIQYNTNGTFGGDTLLQYVPGEFGYYTHRFGTQTNSFNYAGFGTLTAHDMIFRSAGASRWVLDGNGTGAGDLNPVLNNTYAIGTVGLNMQPQYVNVSAGFRIEDRYALSHDTTTLQVGNEGTWSEVALMMDATYRLSVVPGGAIGVGTRTPTARFAITNIGMLVPSFAVYGSNQPAPALLITTNGLVGLGTNAPSSPLHVRPTASGQAYLRIDDTNGTPRFQFGSYIATPLLGAMWLGDQTPASTSYALAGYSGETYVNATTTLSLCSGNSARFKISSAGHLLTEIDNTYDIGASGATRPRNYFGAGYGLFGGLIQASYVVLASGASVAYLIPRGDGIIQLTDTATTGFNRLQFGGTTAAFPAIGRTNGHLKVLAADGHGSSATNALWFQGQTWTGVVNATNINQQAGRVTLAAGQSSYWVTNNLVTASSIVLASQNSHASGTESFTVNPITSAGLLQLFCGNVVTNCDISWFIVAP